MRIEEYFRIWGTYELVDGLYNVKGSVKLIKELEKLPVKFGTISGDFNFYNNFLTTLEGSPTHVGGSFQCSRNYLISLEGCPTKVGGDFYCYINKLTTLEGAPKSVGGDFVCDYNLKNTLEYRQYLIMKKLRQ